MYKERFNSDDEKNIQHCSFIHTSDNKYKTPHTKAGGCVEHTWRRRFTKA